MSDAPPVVGAVPGGRPESPASTPGGQPAPEAKPPADASADQPAEKPDDKAGGKAAGEPGEPSDQAATADPSRAGGAGNADLRRLLADTGGLSARLRLAGAAQDHMSIGNLFEHGVDVKGQLIGSQINYGLAAEPEVRPGPLPGPVYESVRHAYVGTEELERLLEEDPQRRLFIIRASPGSGKLAAGVKLLLLHGLTRILLLQPDQDLNRLSIEEDCGYILCEPPEMSAATARALNAVTPELTAKRAYLVVTVSVIGVGDDDGLHEAVLSLPPPPAGEQVLAAHLRWRLGDERMRTVAEQAEFKALVDDLLQQEAPLRWAGELAGIVATATSDSGDVAFAEVREQVAERVAEAFDSWFDRLDFDDQLHALALAVLHGLPYEYIAEAQRSLARRLSPPVPVVVTGAGGGRTEVPVRPVREPFQVSRRHRLGQLRAVVERGRIPGDLGTAPADTVRFSDHAYPTWVIRRAWSEFSVQDVLLEWLRELATHPAEPVRVWAAEAVGVLATRSFDYLRHAVLEPWAHHRSDRLRTAAAYALHGPAEDPQLRPLVRKTVRDWLDAGDQDDEADGNRSRFAQACAARAYGYPLGRSDPDEALRALHTLAVVDNLWVAIAIGESLAELLRHDNARLAEPILAAILQWLGDHEREATAHLAFIIIATSLLAEPATDDSDGSEVSWPLLLYLADERPVLRGGLAIIWHHLLSNSPYFPRTAENALADWARLLDGDPVGCARLARLLRTAAENDGHVRSYLLAESDGWAAGDVLSPAPNAAAAVRTALTTEG